MLEREYLRTASDLKISQLKKYLSIKLSVSGRRGFDLMVATDDKIVILHDALSLSEIQRHFWRNDYELVVHFRYSKF